MEYSGINFANGFYEYADAAFTDDLGTSSAFSQVCFAPSGRSYIRTNVGAQFSPMVGVARFDVNNYFTNPGNTAAHFRKVYIPPNGAARIQL
jgi:hypothetical protein